MGLWLRVLLAVRGTEKSTAGFAARTEQITVPVCAAAAAQRRCLCVDPFVWTVYSFVEALGWRSSRPEPGVYLTLHWQWQENNLPFLCKQGTVPTQQSECVVHSPKLLVS